MRWIKVGELQSLKCVGYMQVKCVPVNANTTELAAPQMLLLPWTMIKVEFLSFQQASGIFHKAPEGPR